ncbi:MAG: hypothetical protein QOG21_1692 [Actinomycetota bacterium]|jgi:hypothetical protein|nr:hypothetical protein [Actinomycetota bacterium]
MTYRTSALRMRLAIAGIVWALYLGPRRAPRVRTRLNPGF